MACSPSYALPMPWSAPTGAMAPAPAPRALYLDRLQDAIGCSRLDDAAGDALIASISVRFGA
jgi:hypothetical protein